MSERFKINLLLEINLRTKCGEKLINESIIFTFAHTPICILECKLPENSRKKGASNSFTVVFVRSNNSSGRVTKMKNIVVAYYS